jgi:hypothetical protein
MLKANRFLAAIIAAKERLEDKKIMLGMEP